MHGRGFAFKFGDCRAGGLGTQKQAKTAKLQMQNTKPPLHMLKLKPSRDTRRKRGLGFRHTAALRFGAVFSGFWLDLRFRGFELVFWGSGF